MAKDLLKDYTYGEMLATSGYDVDFCVGTTYSMNPKALLIVPLSLGMMSDMNESTCNSQMFLLESIRRSADKFVLFCNRGSIHMPQEVQSFFPLVESCIYEIQNKYKPGSNFHPKVWVLREINRENPEDRQIKVVVMSRNLTLDNNLDMVVSLTGKINTENSRNSKRHQPLVDFLNKLANRIPIPESPFDKETRKKRGKIHELAKDLYKVKRFDVDEDNFEKDAYEFIPMMFGENLNKNLNIDNAFKGEQLMTISPFLDYDILEKMNERVTRYDSILVTTTGYVDKNVFDLYNKDKRCIYVMKDAAKDNDIMSTDLHAKTYFVYNPKGEPGYYLYLGSANATLPAFHANSEFILRLKYKNGKHYIFDNFRKDFLMMDEKDEESLLFEKVNVFPELEESHESSALEQFMRKYVVGDFYAHCSEGENGNYNLYIASSVKSDDYKVHISPLQAPNCRVLLDGECEIKDLPLSAISEFYILESSSDDEKIQKVIKIPTKGIPTHERDIAIFRSVINSKDKFLNYISFMLSDDPETFLFELEEARRMLEKNGDGSDNIQLPQRIYEQMLRIAHCNPGKLDALDEIIEKVDNEEFTKDFKRIYDVFKKALGKK